MKTHDTPVVISAFLNNYAGKGKLGEAELESIFTLRSLTHALFYGYPIIQDNAADALTRVPKDLEFVAVSALVDKMERKETHSMVRQTVARSIAEIGDERTVRSVKHIANRTKDFEIKKTAMNVIEELTRKLAKKRPKPPAHPRRPLSESRHRN